MRIRNLTLALAVFMLLSAPALADAPAASMRAGMRTGAQLTGQFYFALQRWATKHGALFEGMRWFPGDFNGDGLHEFAVVWNDGGEISIDVHKSTGSSFVLERWETRQGALLPGMTWFAGDFTGDGKDELAVQWDDAGAISADVHVSTGSAFVKQRWATQLSGVVEGAQWFAGDFDGDGKRDLAEAFDDGGRRSISVHKSTGSAFVHARWATKHSWWYAGSWYAPIGWFPDDFDGDGKDDLAIVVNDHDQITIEVERSSGSAFVLEFWAIKQGALFEGMLWFPGDFTGDGKDELAVVWNDLDQITIDVHASSGSAFVPERWATKQGALFGGMLWFPGDFNGDGKQELAVVWNDGGQISIDVHASTGGAFAMQRWATKQGNLIDGMLWFVADCNGDGRDDLANRWDDAGMISMDVQVAAVRHVAYVPLIVR